MKDINTLFEDAMEIMREMNIEVDTITSVAWNSRLRTVWGRCTRNNRTNTYSITLNPILADEAVTWEDAMNTMIHEVLHAHKDRFCHTGEWKRCANMINREYEIYHISRLTSAEEKGVADKMMQIHMQNVKYTIRCEGCGSLSYYKKAGKVVQRLMRYPTAHGCRCSCGSTILTLIKS